MSARTRVSTIVCPKCGVEMYSRAYHDFHGCKCGTFVDGGSSYMRFGWPNGFDRPVANTRYVAASRQELYDDWNKRLDKFGFIKAKK